MSRAALAALLAVATASAQPVAPRYESVRLGDALDPAESVRASTEAEWPGPPPDDWLGRDKALHAGGSFLMTLAGQYVLTDKGALSNGEALPVAAGATLALGLAKEVLDSQRPRDPHFCWRDLAADATGVGLAALVVGL
ncbi:hypothetical protein [Rubrivirga marina]|uniref:DUF2279 domain-containing protein n=1 Tax=Rubrivirga marina TaxID=1196024 RepID=A0A271J3C5_9BACT|nr:hypothetical protein [Rubrivirga marina]PAP77778.1 hypothetical protein BSZ37_15665 [Rubrivirga marina]